jgi:HlyD family secretion protein
MKKKQGIIWIAVAIALAAIVVAVMVFIKREPAVQYRTAEVRRGDLSVEVTATGSISPRTTVQVGTQVSGTVSRMFADFNSQVKKGQVIAQLETTQLAAAVEDARANVMKASALATLSAQTCKRTRMLFGKGLVAASDLDQAFSDSLTSAASLNSARAQLDRAKINLSYATIVSPINGTVINRQVDVGQTVAASFNTPTLFTIADDLTHMQVQASIDEADIGQVRDSQKATFSVDAYPDRTFEGVVTAKRLQPSVTQNVVTYTVIIDAPNKELMLLPGMTANITIKVQSVDSVLIVPSSALKFMPPAAPGKGKGEGAPGVRSSQALAGGRATGGDTSGRKTGMRPKDGGRVFVLSDNKLRRVRVIPGLTNGENTAVTGDLTPGMLVVVGTLTSNKPKSGAQQQPFGGGMPRRF